MPILGWPISRDNWRFKKKKIEGAEEQARTLTCSAHAQRILGIHNLAWTRGAYSREKSAANPEKNHFQFLGSTYAEFQAELKNYPPFLFWGFWKV